MAITVQEAQVIFSADGMAQVKTKAAQAGQALDQAAKSAGTFDSKLAKVKGALSGIGGILATIGAGSAAVGMIKLAAEAEQTAIAFDVLLGSAAKSKTMVDDIRALDMKTVFGARELGDAAKMMLNYGVAGESVVPMLSTISDIASGDSMKLEGLTRAFGQMAATGRLMGQDLNQMINAGFNPLEEISRRTGVSMGTLKKKMEDGGISAEMVARAFESATSAGGRFHGMNDRMSQTTAGQFAKLKSNVELLAIEIGTQLLPVANDLIDWGSSLIAKTQGIGTAVGTMTTNVKNWFRDIGDNLSDIGVVFGAVVGHVWPVWKGLFDDLVSHAKATFDWITTNAGIMADNVAIGASNALKIAIGKTTETKNLIDEWGNPVQRTVSTLQPFRETVGFQAPALTAPRNKRSIMESINSELETARRIRQEGRNAENKPKDQAALLDGLKNDRKRTRGEFNSSATGGESDKSKTLSAEALFGSLREGALNKQIGLMKQGVNLQQLQLAAQNKAIAAINKLNLGLT